MKNYLIKSLLILIISCHQNGFGQTYQEMRIDSSSWEIVTELGKVIYSVKYPKDTIITNEQICRWKTQKANDTIQLKKVWFTANQHFKIGEKHTRNFSKIYITLWFYPGNNLKKIYWRDDHTHREKTFKKIWQLNKDGTIKSYQEFKRNKMGKMRRIKNAKSKEADLISLHYYQIKALATKN